MHNLPGATFINQITERENQKLSEWNLAVGAFVFSASMGTENVRNEQTSLNLARYIETLN